MIRFDLNRLPQLYRFKSNTIQLCLSYIKEVIKSSSIPKPKGLHHRLSEIETDLYDIFCRWNFNSIQNGTFDNDLFLPIDTFIQMKDLAYYLKRFHIELDDSLVPFPMDDYNKILKQTIHSSDTIIPPVVQCSDIQLSRLRSIYKGNDFDQDVHKLISRYVYLGGLNNSLSTPPEVLSVFPSHELFGTPLNTCSSFCSPFEDETIFSSHKSFFHFKDYQEDIVYFANPPFDDVLCTQMTDKLLSDLDKKQFSLVIIIPVWDSDQQQHHKLKDFGLPFDAYNRLVKSPYFRSELYLPKNKYPFYNYFYNKYVYISNTHMINLGNPVDLIMLQKTWISTHKK